MASGGAPIVGGRVVLPGTYRLNRNSDLTRGMLSAIVGAYDFVDGVPLVAGSTVGRSLRSDVRGIPTSLYTGHSNGTGAVVPAIKSGGSSTTDRMWLPSGAKYKTRLELVNTATIIVIADVWSLETYGRMFGTPYNASANNYPYGGFSFGADSSNFYPAGGELHFAITDGSSRRVQSTQPFFHIGSTTLRKRSDSPTPIAATTGVRAVAMYGVTRNGASIDFWRDGFYHSAGTYSSSAGDSVATTTSNFKFDTTAPNPTIGGPSKHTSGEEVQGDYLAVFVWDRALSAAEIRQVSVAWDSLIVQPKTLVMPAVASGATNQTATPGVVASTVTVQTPTFPTSVKALPSVVASTVTVQPPTYPTGSKALPSAVSVTAIPLSVTPVASAVALPGVVSVTGTPRAPQPATSQIVTPAVVASTVATQAPTFPTVVVALPGAVASTVTAQVASASVASGGAVNQTATPVVVASTVTVQAPTFPTSTQALPGAVASTVTAQAPQVPTAVIAKPAYVSVTVVAQEASASTTGGAVNQVATPGVIASTVTVQSVSAANGVVALPGVVQVTTTAQVATGVVGAQTPINQTATPPVIQGVVTTPAPDIPTSQIFGALRISAVVAPKAPQVLTSAIATPPAVSSNAQVLSVRVVNGVVALPSLIQVAVLARTANAMTDQIPTIAESSSGRRDPVSTAGVRPAARVCGRRPPTTHQE